MAQLRSLLLVWALLLAACSPPATRQSSGAPTTPPAPSSAAYPAPATAPAPTSAAPTAPAPSPTAPPPSARPTPSRVPRPTDRPTALPAPFRATVARRPLDPPGGSYIVGWSRDGSQLLYASRIPFSSRAPLPRATQVVTYPLIDAVESLALLDLRTGRAHQIVPEETLRLYDYDLRAVWDQDHGAVVYARAKTTATVDLVARDLDGQLLRTFAQDVPVEDASIGPDGQVARLSPQGLTLWRLGAADRVVAWPDVIAQTLASSPPGTYLRLWLAPDGVHYALALGSDLHIGDLSSTTLLRSYRFDDHRMVLDLKWSPDSTAVYYRRLDVYDMSSSNRDSYAHRISEVVPARLGRGARLPPGGVPIGAIWTPDSRWLIILGGITSQCGGTPEGCHESLRIVSPFGSEAQFLVDDNDSLQIAGAWSPDGTQLAEVCGIQLVQKPAGPQDFVSQLCLITIQEHH